MKKALRSIIAAVAFSLILIFTGCSGPGLYEIVRDKVTGGQLVRKEESAGENGPDISDYLIDFTLMDLEKKEVSLSDNAGKILVVNFWATWCQPCREEIPDFIEVYGDYKDKRVQFIGISNEDR